MPPRSKVFELPEAVRDELNARLVNGGFGGYAELKDWLEAQGFSISIGALHRYGSKLQSEFEAAMADVRRTQELAKALVGREDSDQGELMAAAEKIAQDGLIRLQLALREAEDLEPERMAEILPKITRAIADLNRAGISRAKWQEAVRAKIEARMKRLESQAAEGEKRGLDSETLRIVRQEIYGIV